VTSLPRTLKVRIPVDALDECEANAELLSDIFDLQMRYKLKLLATSRPVPDVVNRFAEAQIVEGRASTSDVET
jgi:hypothetical protein